MTATWPSASPCTTRPSWPGISVPYWWGWLGWEAFCIHWFSYCWSFCCPSVDLKWSITFFLWLVPLARTCLHQHICHWSAGGGQKWDHLPVDLPHAGCLLRCHPHSLRSHHAKGRRKALSTCGAHFPGVALFFVPRIITYMCPSFFIYGQKHGSVLWYPDSYVESTHLYPEKWRGKKCHDNFLHIVRNCRWIMNGKAGKKNCFISERGTTPKLFFFCHTTS